MKNILVLHGEGIGNCVQIFPLLRTLKELLGYNVYYCHAFGSYPIDKSLCPYVTAWLDFSELNTLKPENFDGVVSTFWARDRLPIVIARGFKSLCCVHPISPNESEVYTYLKIAEDLGASHNELIWEATCRTNTTDRKFDVVLCDGYKKIGHLDWSVKSFAYYDKLIQQLKADGLSVASVGAANEYLKGTVDMTGLPLKDSISLIKNSKLLISNDTGIYHCANLVGTKTIVLFTAMSSVKNYNKYFHKNTTVIYRKDLDCIPCQGQRDWTTCKSRNCKYIPLDEVYTKAKELLC